MDYFQLIEKRKSIREFRDKEVPDEMMQEIWEAFKLSRRLIPQLDMELVIFGDDVAERIDGHAGYKGFMIKAPYYLVLLTDSGDFSGENTGFVGEELVLKLTEMGLESCWITFGDPNVLKPALEITSDKEIAAVIAFGYGKKEGLLRRLEIKSPSNVIVKERKGFMAPKIDVDDMYYEEAWGQKGSAESLTEQNDLRRALEAASLAPTTLNRQPFRFIVDGGTVVLVMMDDEFTSAHDLSLDAGVVMQHFACVYAQWCSREIQWVLESPKKDYGIPQGCHAWAYCLI